MVGVKGKYKGCNTCRGRRVKCDNTRPFCKRCTDHGRVCEGYELETVFIVGTVDDKGRCASHPPRNLAGPGPPASSSSSPSPSRGSGGRKKTARFASPSPGRGALLRPPPQAPPPPTTVAPASAERAVPPARHLAPVEPLAPAWDDGIVVRSPPGALHRLRFLAIRTRLGAVAAAAADGGSAPRNEEIKPALPPSGRGSETPRFDSQERFRMASQCFLRLPPQDSEGGTCLFLYEPNFSAAYNNTPPWKTTTAPRDDVLDRGPASFQTFPAHHFFARVYRPVAILTTLLTRTPSPLAAHEWTTVPYERHPPTPLDALLDILALVPGLLARADRLNLAAPYHLSSSSSSSSSAAAAAAPALGRRRRLEARDLVANCAAVEARLAAWYEALERAAAENRDMPLLYWTAGSLDFTFAGGHWRAGSRREGVSVDVAAHIPFADTYEFASTVVGLGHVMYWTGLMILYECMDGLVKVVLGPGGNDITTPGPALEMGSSSSTAAAAAVAAPASYQPPGLPPSCNPARYRARERRKLAANICRSLDWVIGSSCPDGSLPVASLSPSFPSAPCRPLDPPLASVSPPSPSSSSSCWVPLPPLMPSTGPMPPIRSPQTDPAMARGSLGSVDPEPRDDAPGYHHTDHHHHRSQHRGGGIAHPDLASIPLWAVERFYDGLGDDGELERAWCLGFRSRLGAVGRAVDGGVGGGWLEVARFG